MAIDYTKLFTHTGKIIKYLNAYRLYATSTFPTDENVLEDILAVDENYDLLTGMPEMYLGFQDGVLGWLYQMAQKIEKGFTDRTRVLNQLSLSSSSGIQTVLPELIRDMNNNTKTVKKSAVTLGAYAQESGSVGTAEVFTTKILDGASKPRNDVEAHLEYRGLNSELGVTSETMTLTCLTDSNYGATEGGETFRWDAGVKYSSGFDWRGEGSGPGPMIQVANAQQLVRNGEFENWTSTNTPDNWTLGTGAVAGTTILRESTNKKRGTYAFSMKGTGAATIQVYQTITGLIPNKSYFVGAWLLGDATIAGTSAFTMQFSGTGYTPGATEKISLAQAALAALTAYDLQGFFVNTPAVMPSDFALEIKATGTLTTNAKIYVDGLVLKPTDWHGGVGAVIVAGGTALVKGDRYTFTVANDNAGVFQTFARRHLKIQFPSDSSPSISDTLAT